jgi:uncharacterized protein (DUF849 family)
MHDAGSLDLPIHARDDRGQPDWRTERFSEILGAIRARHPEAILCVTTSGRGFAEVERRMAALDAEPRPEMASLTLGSLIFKDQASVNDPATIERLAGASSPRRRWASCSATASASGSRTTSAIRGDRRRRTPTWSSESCRSAGSWGGNR